MSMMEWNVFFKVFHYSFNFGSTFNSNMQYTFIDFLALLGALGFFLYGMKLMSESLQKVAGDKLRNILAAMTSNRIKGVFTGFMITALVQSSTATTVMLVSFVNAGLINLIQAIGVVMGANIGTTVTAWLISLLGFKFSISYISLPIIGLSFPFLFSKSKKKKSIAELMIGFAMVFLGLEFLKESLPNIHEHQEILAFLSAYTDLGIWSILIFLGIGTLLTFVIQSSSATMALTLVMTNNGWISYDMAAAMVLGENIGTTITANIAASIANVSAKRTARAHLVFNLIGVIWVLLIFKFFLGSIDRVLTGAGLASPFVTATGIPVALSVFHTAFNVLNTLLLIGFAPLIAKFVSQLVPRKVEDEEEFRLKYINTGILSTSELALFQAKKEISVYARRCKKMMDYTRTLFNSQKEADIEYYFSKVEKYEEISDRMEEEIAIYLTKVSSGHLSPTGSQRVQTMLKLIDNIESISDSCHNVAKAIYRQKQKNIIFPPSLRDNVNKMLDLVERAHDIMIDNLDEDYHNVKVDTAIDMEFRVNRYRDKLKKEHIKKIKEKEYKYDAGVIYNDIISHCERMGDHIVNVTESIIERFE
jgi:phosphate:Na+ symporter